jgi:hypothetical protein
MSGAPPPSRAKLINEKLETVYIILRSENDHDTKPSCTLVGHHVPPGQTMPTPRADTPYEWNYSNVLEHNRNGNFAIGAPMEKGSAIRFQVPRAAWPDSPEFRDLESQARDLMAADAKQLVQEFKDVGGVRGIGRDLKEGEDEGRMAYLESKNDAPKRCVWWEIKKIEVWR